MINSLVSFKIIDFSVGVLIYIYIIVHDFNISHL